MARGKTALLPERRRRQPAITALYCSDVGEVYSNERMRSIYRKRVYPHVGDETAQLYEKLLSKTPERTRRLTVPLERIIDRGDPHSRFARFRHSAEQLLADAGRGALREAGLEADAIDILVVNYMAGKTLPSLAAITCNQLGLREDVVALTLGDMGCSAAVAAIDLVCRMLAGERAPRRALVLSLEPVTNLFSTDDHLGTVVGNTLFGEGCAGVVLSTHREPALWRIAARQRVLVADEAGIGSITLEAGAEGPRISLDRRIPDVAGVAVEANLKRLVPQIIGLGDKLRYLVTKKAPRWQAGIDRWALHPGGVAVLRGLEKSLKLASADLGPSYRVFHERSNMSSPSVIYALENVERSAPAPGERLLLMSFGSGFQVNSMMLTREASTAAREVERTAVVIGGTSGIGLDAARLFVERGYRVVVGSRRAGDAEAEFERLDGVTYLGLDVTDPDSVAAFGRAVWERSFGVDALVVSSGVAPAPALAGRLDEGEMSRTVETNLTGAMRAVNALLPQLRTQGKLVLLSSILGRVPLMGNAVYCATKAGLDHFAEALQLELQRAGRKVSVHSLHPAYVETPMLDSVASESSRTFLAPIKAARVTVELSKILDGKASSGGYVLLRDRAIAGLYRYLPRVFRKVVTSL